jgi:hypothetical protein
MRKLTIIPNLAGKSGFRIKNESRSLNNAVNFALANDNKVERDLQLQC